MPNQNRRRLTPDHRWQSAAEMRALFADLPEPAITLSGSQKRCAYMPPARSRFCLFFLLPKKGRSEADELHAQAELD